MGKENVVPFVDAFAKKTMERIVEEGRSPEELAEALVPFTHWDHEIIRCRDCALQHNVEKCFIAALCHEKGVRDYGFDDFWCADGKRKDVEE